MGINKRKTKEEIQIEAIKGLTFGNELIRRIKENKFVKKIQWIRMILIGVVFVWIIWCAFTNCRGG